MLDDQNPWRAKSERDGKSVAIERLGTKQEHIRPSSAKGALKGALLYSRGKDLQNGMRTTRMHHPYSIWIRHGQHPPVRP